MVLTNELIIVFPLFVAIAIYIIEALNWDFQLWTRDDKLMKKSSIMKAAIFLLLAWLCLPLVQLSIEANANGGFGAKTDTLLTIFYTTFSWLNYVLTVYMFIYFTLNLLLYLGVDVIGAFKK